MMGETEESPDILTREAPAPDLTVGYGPLPEHVADVRLPPESSPSPPAPLVIFWHGGFWRAQCDRHHLGPLASDLAARGYVVVTPEYRRTGDGSGGGGGGGWPMTFEDVLLAAAKLPAMLDGQLPGQIDLGRVVLGGHSAGGHLAVWAAGRDAVGQEMAPGASVSGVLALAPVLDLADAFRLKLGRGAVGALLGGSPQEFAERYAAADPSLLDPLAARLTIVHGDRDPSVPIEMSRNYRDRTGCALVEIEGGDHFAVIDPRSKAWSSVVRELAVLSGNPT
jgi:acetyl esterase/lipase